MSCITSHLTYRYDAIVTCGEVDRYMYTTTHLDTARVMLCYVLV